MNTVEFLSLPLCHALIPSNTGTSLYDNLMLPQLQSEILKSTGTDSLPLEPLMCLCVYVMMSALTGHSLHNLKKKKYSRVETSTLSI